MGSTVTSFREQFNNHKSNMEITGEHLYLHFFTDGHNGLIGCYYKDYM
jgi:hypothetical protein